MYGRYAESEKLLECLGHYLSKKEVRLHRQNFFDKTVPQIMKQNDDLAVMEMMRAVLKAIPYNSGFIEGQETLKKLVMMNFVKNDTWIWIDTQIAIAAYCKYSFKWQTLEKNLMDHSNRRSVVLSIVNYITHFSDILRTAEQCIYLFCYIKHMIDNLGINRF